MFRTRLIPVAMLTLISGLVLGQQLQHPVAITGSTAGRPGPDVRAWSDPALNHNKLVQQQTDGGYKMVGTYKVVGTSYLFGEHHKGDMFAPEAKAYNIYLSYNTYNQEVEFYSTSNPDKSLTREPGTLDSFVIHANIPAGILTNMKFIYGSHIGSKEQAYFLEMYSGSRFSLYKRYKSDLDFVASNLGQSELRQFDLQYDYFYYDKEKKSMKKLKANASTLIKEFKSTQDLSNILSNEDFTPNPEEGLRKAFKALDKSKGF